MQIQHKENKCSKFIDTELEADSESELESDSKLKSKLESEFYFTLYCSIDHCVLNGCLQTLNKSKN